MSHAASAELVRHLGHANGWWRDTAQRLLVERQDRLVTPLLQEAILRPTSALAAVHALWTLQGLESLDDRTLLHALHADDPNIREHAVRLAEGRLGADELKKAVLAQAAHKAAAVRFQASLTLGEISGDDNTQALVQIARLDARDEWSRLAILSSLEDKAWPFLKLWLEEQRVWQGALPEEQIQFLVQIAGLIGARNQDAELAECLQRVSQLQEPTPLAVRLALLSGLAEGMARTTRPLRTLLSKSPSMLQDAARSLDQLLQAAGDVARSDKEQSSLRILAIQTISRARHESTGLLMLELLAPEQPLAIQSAAARGLGEVFNEQLGRQVLDRWGTYSIGTRRDIVSTFLRSPSSAAVLLEALEQARLSVGDLDSAARDILQRIPQLDIQRRAREFLAKNVSADRVTVVGRYQESLRLDGDPQRGAGVFLKHCSACHRWQSQGHRVGPDLSGVASRPAAALLDDILHPSKEVAPDFVNYMLLTKQGQVLTGLLATETATAVKLRRAEGLEEVVLRSEVAELRASGKSLMPEGLEQSLGLQEMADLLKFLQQASVPAR
jgi:putative heme-binding domain-containing protein